ncbi:MAG: branched-chain amino acid ABC transporter permease [Pseudolabrys sp.]|nr:branched-chain amino acid ABC transporter permease [Pseudolabrys sp.]MDP2297133.1 branched-chain amino acid ABC transporter permease [Pseudolabrys sp.]
MSVADHAPRLDGLADQRSWSARIPLPWWIAAVVLLLLPIVANNFWLFQVMGWTFILGMIGLSLMFLAGYGGMVSLLQMTIAGMAGYMVAILGPSGAAVSLGLSWWIVLPAAFLIAAAFATICGALAVRTDGIYTIMITLAIAAAFFYFTRQNYTIFNGYSGFNLVLPPKIFGVNWRDPVAFYYLALACAALCYGAVVYLARTPFGLALQGVRDNPRRMAALGFNVTAHRVAAYALASVFASTGGILLVWQNAQIAPGTIGISAAIDVLVVAVVGGLRRPLGPFIGAFIYVILQVFSTDILGFFGFAADRFKLIIGIGFLAVVLFSPDGVLALWDRWRARAAAQKAAAVTGGGT